MTALCEGLMLGCFGLSWPINVAKSLRSRSAKGKSIFFEIVIIAGYLCGICGKFYAGNFNFVLALYFINLFVVSIDLVLTIRNKRLDLSLERSETDPEAPIADIRTMQQAAITEEPEDLNTISDSAFIPVLAKESLRQLR